MCFNQVANAKMNGVFLFFFSFKKVDDVIGRSSVGCFFFFGDKEVNEEVSSCFA